MLEIPLMTGAALTAFWGLVHLFATKGVVAGFGDISVDNRRVITMEWIVEGISLIFIGLLVAAVTLTDGTSATSRLVCYCSAAVLITLAGVSFATGFKVNFLPYKLCPFIFGASALLFVFGAAA